MTNRHFKYEGWLYALAFIIAVGLRFTQLGAMPLSDLEAAPALQALRLVQSLKPALSAHPFYILSTSVIFFLYGSGTNFLARFIPALLGSLLVFAPRLFENRLSPRPSLILAFFIAIDPGMVSLSRHAASSIIAITFLLLTLGYINQNKPRLAGVFAALTLLSGPYLWSALLGLGIAFALYQVLEFRSSRTESETENDSDDVEDSPNEEEDTFDLRPLTFDYKESLTPFAVTLLTVGTLFFLVPNGLSAALASIPAFIKMWGSPSSVPPGRLLFSLAVYQPFPVLLAIIAIVRGWWSGERRIIPLSLVFLVFLLLAVFIPSRQVSDLGWAIIPLLTLAALELGNYTEIFADERGEIFGVTMLVAFLWVFAWLDFSGMVWYPPATQQYLLRLALLIGSLALLVVSLVLVAAGWSIRSAKFGAIWGLALGMGALGLGGTLGSAGLRGLANPELWWSPNLPAQADLLSATVNEISNWGTGNNNAASVVIAGINSPALEWTLRDHDVKVVEVLDPADSPYFVVTPLQNNPTLASAYRGQDFTWRQTPSWEIAQSRDWIRWLALREMPQTGEAVILWARSDLFIDQ
jgi:hypothetical protein